MSLFGSLNIGRNALAVQQGALQITSNNIANAGNTDYTRQSGRIVSAGDQRGGNGFLSGGGVDLIGINRNIDNALQGRLRSAVSDNNAAGTAQQWLGQVESVFNALGSTGLDGQLSAFFNSWSKLANAPQDAGQRQVVLTSGQGLARSFNSVSSQLDGIQTSLDQNLSGVSGDATRLAQQVADLNKQISVTEGGGNGQANNLRDQRDAALKQLSQLVNISTTEDKGQVNVFIGSQPLVLGSANRGLSVQQTIVNGVSQASLAFQDDGGPVPATGGQLGGLLAVRQAVSDVQGQVDGLAGNLIFELNKIHSSGQGLVGFSSTSSTNVVADPTAALDTAGAGLAFKPTNGSFVVQVTNKSTGQVTSTLVKVNLSGTGAPTTLNSLAGDLNGVSGLSAAVVNGKLTISGASPDVTFSFSQDSSGALAALGVNSFFTGTDASTVGVNAALTGNPQLLAASANGSAGDNTSAVTIAALNTKPLASLQGLTLRGKYNSTIINLASNTAIAKTEAAAADNVQQTLEAQRESLSGVSTDEESINLVQQQKAYQAAAQLVSTVNQMLETILAMLK